MFSCSSIGVKLGGGIGSAIVGWLLAWGNFDGTAAVQPTSAVNVIFFMYAVALIFEADLILNWRYRVPEFPLHGQQDS